MNLQEALAHIRAAHVPEYKYVTDGGLGTGECYGIERDATGWSIYYSERGRKTPLERYASEDAASRAFVARVTRG